MLPPSGSNHRRHLHLPFNRQPIHISLTSAEAHSGISFCLGDLHLHSIATAWKEAWVPGNLRAEAFPLEDLSSALWCARYLLKTTQWIGRWKPWRNSLQTQPIQLKYWLICWASSWVWGANPETPKTCFCLRNWKDWHHPSGGRWAVRHSRLLNSKDHQPMWKMQECLTPASPQDTSRSTLLFFRLLWFWNSNLLNWEEREKAKEKLLNCY